MIPRSVSANVALGWRLEPAYQVAIIGTTAVGLDKNLVPPAHIRKRLNGVAARELLRYIFIAEEVENIPLLAKRGSDCESDTYLRIEYRLLKHRADPPTKFIRHFWRKQVAVPEFGMPPANLEEEW